MEKDFWFKRWERSEIGFHESAVNANLKQYWNKLNIVQQSRVFVPLCGKSVDMHWLRAQGYPVAGVELSSIAAQAFYQEQGYVARRYADGKFEHYEANNIHIYCGDFFDLSREDMAGVEAVYDRASMVALPPDLRERYVQHLLDIMSPGVKILLVAFDYPQQEMQGPPFAVTTAEVEALYGKFADVNLLAQIDVLPQNPRFQKKGLTRLQENIFLLTVH
jgi:thiopurine S-methyltransferase